MPDTTRCALCGDALAAQEIDAGSTYCAACAIEAAERNLAPETPAAERATKRETGPGSRSKRLRVLLVVALLIFTAAATFAIPRFLALASLDRPLREGALDTDAKTDACIENLWILAGQAQEQGKTSEELTCPESGASYRVTGTGKDATISCPNPDAHGLQSLSISVRDGAPKATR